MKTNVFTNRKKDLFLLSIITLVLFTMIGLHWHNVSYQWEDMTYSYTIMGLIISIINIVPFYLSVFGGLILYLARDKERLPKHMFLFSWNKGLSTSFVVLYSLIIIVYFECSLFLLCIPPPDWMSQLDNYGMENADSIIGFAQQYNEDYYYFISVCKTITLGVFTLLNILGVILWIIHKRKLQNE